MRANRTVFKIITGGALALAVGFGAALAQYDTGEAETYVVVAGADADGEPANVFTPEMLQIHRGDTVTWTLVGAHNTHFRQPGVAGGGRFQAFTPTIGDGDMYRGGDANSGVITEADEPPTFSLIIDVAPGEYAYICDLHPEMAGTIEVVEDEVEIPKPEEVASGMEATPEATAEGTAEATDEPEATATPRNG